MVDYIDVSRTYTFSGFDAYVLCGVDVKSGREYVEVREIGSRALLAWSMDLRDIALRLTPR